MTDRMNWAGTHEFTAPEIFVPLSIDEVRARVREPGAVRALGTRHSFTDLADGPGSLISTAGLPADPVLDEAGRTVTVGAGTRYGVLAPWLDARGWALHNLGSLPHISIGGAVATGTHGSGHANRALSAAVAAVDFVDAAGDLVRVTRGDPRFDGLVVGLGASGIVVRVTLDVEPSYAVRQDVYAGVGWDAFLADPDAVTGAADSVSVFARWSDPHLEQVWLKERRPAGAPAGSLLDGRRLEVPTDFSRVPGIAASFTAQGTVGPWHERLPHFRFDATPSAGEELQTEYFVARSVAAAALTAVRALASLIDPLLFITELRTVAADSSWLSGAYERDALAIHFTWRRDADGVRAVLPSVEAALRPFDARPHWGKLHLFSADDVARVHPRLGDARRLFAELDPHRRFSNDHLARLGVRDGPPGRGP